MKWNFTKSALLLALCTMPIYVFFWSSEGGSWIDRSIGRVAAYLLMLIPIMIAADLISWRRRVRESRQASEAR